MSDRRALSVRIDRKAFAASDGQALLAIKNLAFEMRRNALTCLIGPSGCGKTTTLRILAGLDEAFEGAIDPFFGSARKAVVFQEPTLLPWRTVEENVRLALGRARQGADLDGLFDALELRDMRGRFPGELSLGLARRVALARAFAVAPELLFLDEPFVSLDETVARRLRGLLLKLWQERPTTVLMVTHNLREAVELADRLILMSPRPAKVVDTIDIEIPREGRRGPAGEGLLRELSESYPDIVAF